MRDALLALPWAMQMGVIFGSVIVSLLAVVAVHDLVAWAWNRRRTRAAIARREVRS